MFESVEDLLASLQVDNNEIEKSAGDKSAPSLAKETETLLSGDKNQMSKQAAYDFGRQLASEIIKQANLMTDQNDRIVADQEAQVFPTPDGSIDEVLKGLIARARGAGAEDYDPDLESVLGRAAEGNFGEEIPDAARLAMLGSDEPGEEGVGKLLGTSPREEEVEKISAMLELVDNGIPFEQASELVKRASDALESENNTYSDIEKAAAVAELMMEHGISFDDASSLVKAAAEEDEDDDEESEEDRNRRDRRLRRYSHGLEGAAAGSAGLGALGALIGYGHGLNEGKSRLKSMKENRHAKGIHGPKVPKEVARKLLKGNTSMYMKRLGAAGALAGSLAGSIAGASLPVRDHEKAAALSNLLDNGYGFDDAVAIIESLS